VAGPRNEHKMNKFQRDNYEHNEWSMVQDSGCGRQYADSLCNINGSGEDMAERIKYMSQSRY
jgi:hypothetical protein